jgi:hypothetical protein
LRWWATPSLHGSLATLFLKFPPSPYPFCLDLVTPSNPTPKEHNNSDEPEQNSKPGRNEKERYSHEKEDQYAKNYQEIIGVQSSTLKQLLSFFGKKALFLPLSSLFCAFDMMRPDTMLICEILRPVFTK